MMTGNPLRGSRDDSLPDAGSARRMRAAYTDLRAVRDQYQCDLRTAAFVLAVGRVAKATELRGLM